MEYRVVYNSNHGVGIGNSRQLKRKRYEKAAPQLDGVLVVHKTVSEGLLDQTNAIQPTSQMSASLYKIRQIEVDAYESSSSEDPGVGTNEDGSNDGDDDDDDDDFEDKSKKLSWKARQKCLSRVKSKRVSKEKKPIILHKTSGQQQTSKTMVYSGNITQVQSGSRCDSSNANNSTLSRLLSVDDTFILGPYNVHIVGTVAACSVSSNEIDVPSTGNNKENSAALNKSIVRSTHDTVSLKTNYIQQKQITSCQSIVPVRTIVTLPLQSKHNLNKTVMPFRKKQSPELPVSSLPSSSNIIRGRSTLLTRAVPKKIGTHDLGASSSSGRSMLQKSIAISTKSLHQPVTHSYGAHRLNNTTAQVLPHLPLPASIRTALRPHQVDGVDFMWRTLNEKKGCILGDEMGLGKTLMTIACIAAIHRTHREKQFVVVCPSTLVANWSNEFDKWLGPASQPKRVPIQEGGAEGIQQIRAYMQKTNQQIKHQPGQVLIISYEFFRRNVTIFDCKGHTSLALLVVDEGHRLKNAGDSQTFRALASLPTDARLCITATPIQNNLCEFFNLADFCCPGLLGPNISYFRKYYECPISATNQKNATRQQLIEGAAKAKELDAISKTFMIRRLQKDILKSMLPPRTEALLFCRPTKMQCALYRSVCSQINLRNISDALTALIKLRMICAHPVLYSSIDGNEATLDHYESEIALSGKMIVLRHLLQQIRVMACDDKVVIVSNFTSVLSLVERLILQPLSYSYLRLDGTSKDRQALVDTFNGTSVNRSFCLLLSSKAGGCGLNIVGANRLIMFDADWNPATCQQAMGRIYRQGQKKPCIIYRLFTSGTIEEVILQRQIIKRGLSHLAADLHGGYVEKFSKEELAGCFDLKENCVCDTKDKLATNWPPYDKSCIQSLGGHDKPLLKVALEVPDSLCFVHFDMDCESASDEGRQHLSQNSCSQVGYESDDDENEFTL